MEAKSNKERCPKCGWTYTCLCLCVICKAVPPRKGGMCCKPCIEKTFGPLPETIIDGLRAEITRLRGLIVWAHSEFEYTVNWTACSISDPELAEAIEQIVKEERGEK